MPSVLVIEQDASHRALVEAVSRSLGLTSEWVAADSLDLNRIDLLSAAVVLFDGSPSNPAAKALLKRLANHHAKVPVIAIASRPVGAIEAMRAGACEVLYNPLSADELRDALAMAMQLRVQSHTSFAVRDTSELTGASADLLVGRSPAMRRIYKSIGTAAAHEIPVLITGETGTGKRTVARVIHDHGRRQQEACSVIECHPEMHFDDSVGGPDNPKRSAKPRHTSSTISLPRCGTCILAEVDRLSPSEQQRLLGYLCRRQDGDPAMDIPDRGAPRVIATASVAAAWPAAGSLLRADLYYELGRIVITPPPLRERLEDLPLLAEHFLRSWSRQLGKRVYQNSPEAIERLNSHHWPGNLRELSSVVCRALVGSKGNVLVADDFAQLTELASPATAEDETTIDWRRFVDEQWATNGETLYAAALETMDRRLLRIVLQRTGGNQARAAKVLGMTRGRLRQKLRERGIIIDRLIDVHACAEDRPRASSSSIATR